MHYNTVKLYFMLLKLQNEALHLTFIFIQSDKKEVTGKFGQSYVSVIFNKNLFLNFFG